MKRLARDGRGVTGPAIYVGKSRPFDAVRATGLGVFGALLLSGGIAILPFVLPHNRISVRGLSPDNFLTPAALNAINVTFTAQPGSALKRLRVRVDGQPANVVVVGDHLQWVPPPLAEGRHRVVLQSGSRFLWRAPARKVFRLEIDSVAPTLTVDDSKAPIALDQPLTVSGDVEKNATVKVAGRAVLVTKGKFSQRFAVSPIGMLRVEAIDQAGNSTVVERRTFAQIPQLQGVHMSATSWTNPNLKDPVMKLGDQGQINAVVLDLKDEQGMVGYRSALTRISDIGAASNTYNLASAVAELHARKLRVVGRIVTFRDPILTRASINAGRFDEVVQGSDGRPYEASTFGAFANPASLSVRTYILDIAREAAKLGVDDILLDDVRRPEGTLSELRFPGLPEVSVESVDAMMVQFLQEAAASLAGTKTRLGISVFGIAARHPDDVGQNVSVMARYVDYVAPVVYPSQWRTGYYNVLDPANSPYEIVSRSVRQFTKQTEGTDAAVLPWLQDFSLPPGRKYGAAEVREQIRAVREQRTGGFLIWDPKVTYTASAIPDDAPKVPVPLSSGVERTAATVPSLASTTSSATRDTG